MRIEPAAPEWSCLAQRLLDADEAAALTAAPSLSDLLPKAVATFPRCVDTSDLWRGPEVGAEGGCRHLRGREVEGVGVDDGGGVLLKGLTSLSASPSDALGRS